MEVTLTYLLTSIYPVLPEEKRKYLSRLFFFVIVIIFGIICKLHFLNIILHPGHWSCLFYIFIYSTSKQSLWF